MISRRISILVPTAFVVLIVAAATPARLIVGEGVIRSDERVALKSKLALPIHLIAVKEGQIVRQGELLVEMANEVQRAQVAEIELQLEIAKRELERNLKVPDLITEKELELSRDAVKRAQAQLATAQANLEETLIRAPFDGLVSRVYVRVGDTPKGSDTLLLDFLSLDKLTVEVALPLNHLKRVREGMVARLEVENETASIKTSLLGKVRYIYPEIDSTTRMFRVKVDIPQKDLLVRPGMFVKVVIEPSSEPR
jgi:membrane fusion protein (multidrug efflux system)